MSGKRLNKRKLDEFAAHVLSEEFGNPPEGFDSWFPKDIEKMARLADLHIERQAAVNDLIPKGLSDEALVYLNETQLPRSVEKEFLLHQIRMSCYYFFLNRLVTLHEVQEQTNHLSGRVMLMGIESMAGQIDKSDPETLSALEKLNDSFEWMKNMYALTLLSLRASLAYFEDIHQEVADKFGFGMYEDFADFVKERDPDVFLVNTAKETAVLFEHLEMMEKSHPNRKEETDEIREAFEAQRFRFREKYGEEMLHMYELMKEGI